MRLTDTSDLWWKTAVVYCLDVETFMDWNDDGHGDFEGLAHRLDYLAELGVTCIWLMPFYVSPGMDDGYDVSDFYGVDPRFGHLGDVVEVIRTARDRGLRVIADLVVNHTSEKHPWFQSALEGRDSPHRDFYVWRDEPPEDPGENMFPDAESGVWTLDESSGQYYLHNFYRHQPDLNIANPRVRDEIAKVIGFWMELGISGFRVDAVPYLVEQDLGPRSFIQTMRSYLSRRRGEAILLGEVNRPYDEQLELFGGPDGHDLTMQFDFVANQRMFLSLARGSARPLIEALTARPRTSVEAQWANFVRSHDELTLDQLSDDERQEVFDAFAPEEHQRIWGRGIVRRLAPMLDGDPRRIRLVYSLLFSLPGTPVLYYGEELGMGEQPDASGRHAVRTPMQWNDTRNGGFSNAPADALVEPMASGGWSPEHVNASQQRHDPDSLLNFVRVLIDRYRASAEIGWGELELLEQPHDAVLAHAVRGAEGTMIALHNLSAEPVTVPLDLGHFGDDLRLDELLGVGEHEVPPTGRIEFSLDAYGFRWLRVLNPGAKRLA